MTRPHWRCCSSTHPGCILSCLLQEAQTPQIPPNLFPCPPDLPQHHSRWPGAARVPQGDTQGCSVVSGVTIVTEQHLCFPAVNLLFHLALRWTLFNSFLPLHLPWRATPRALPARGLLPSSLYHIPPHSMVGFIPLHNRIRMRNQPPA